MSVTKWIFGGLGFVLGGPIGALVGVLIGSLFDYNIKKYDVVLYMRNDKTLVLHRIIRAHKDSFTMCGDNQCILEKHVKRSQIIAVMEGFYKGEEYFPCTNKNYQKYVRKIIFKRPFKYLKHLIKKILKRK